MLKHKSIHFFYIKYNEYLAEENRGIKLLGAPVLDVSTITIMLSLIKRQSLRSFGMYIQHSLNILDTIHDTANYICDSATTMAVERSTPLRPIEFKNIIGVYRVWMTGCDRRHWNIMSNAQDKRG